MRKSYFPFLTTTIEYEAHVSMAKPGLLGRVYTWLSQVEAGLWDGCAFVRNAPHVLQATTRNMEHVSQQRRFAKAKKEIDESLAFQDYSKKFPHEKYTLGFAGRPGGPDFYVSTQDNTYNHGPGGQQSYALKEEADSK